MNARIPCPCHQTALGPEIGQGCERSTPRKAANTPTWCEAVAGDQRPETRDQRPFAPLMFLAGRCLGQGLERSVVDYLLRSISQGRIEECNSDNKQVSNRAVPADSYDAYVCGSPRL